MTQEQAERIPTTTTATKNKIKIKMIEEATCTHTNRIRRKGNVIQISGYNCVCVIKKKNENWR